MPGQRNAKRVGRHASQLEQRVEDQLTRAGADFLYGKPVLAYHIPAVYVGDFEVKRHGGGSFVLEVKGYFPQEDRRKMRNVKRANPDLDIRFLFQNAQNRISKAKRAMTYGEWATKHGFPWADGGEVPEEWLR